MPDHLCQTAGGGNYADVASAAKAHPKSFQEISAAREVNCAR